MRLADLMGYSISERVTTASAVPAIFIWQWLPSLEGLSAGSAKVAPILGVAWIVFQFGRALRDEWRK